MISLHQRTTRSKMHIHVGLGISLSLSLCLYEYIYKIGKSADNDRHTASLIHSINVSTVLRSSSVEWERDLGCVSSEYSNLIPSRLEETIVDESISRALLYLHWSSILSCIYRSVLSLDWYLSTRGQHLWTVQWCKRTLNQVPNCHRFYREREEIEQRLVSGTVWT